MPDELEVTGDGNTIDPSTSLTADNAATESAPAENQTSSDPALGGPSVATESAPAENPNGNDSGSLKAGNESKQQQSAPFDYQKGYKEIQSWATKTRQENLELQRRLQEFERRHQEAQTQAAPQVREWDPQSPKHAQFLDLVKTAQHYDRIINATQDENFRNSLIAMRDEELGKDGIQTLREWRNDVRRQEWERQINPDAYYRKVVQQYAQPIVQNTLQSTSQSYQQAKAAQENVQKWLTENKEIATPDNLQKIQQMMTTQTATFPNGMPFEVAAAQMERDHYRSQLSSRAAKDASVEEKQRLLEGKAAGAIARNPSSRTKVDLQKLRQDVPDSRVFIDKLFELDQQGLL